METNRRSQVRSVLRPDQRLEMQTCTGSISPLQQSRKMFIEPNSRPLSSLWLVNLLQAVLHVAAQTLG